MKPQWYVARTKPQGEFRVLDAMTQLGVKVFLPLTRTQQMDRSWKTSPLFPGYIFIRCDLTERSGSQLSQIPQLLGLVYFGSEIPAITDSMMDRIVHQVDVIRKIQDPDATLTIGQKVRVIMGGADTVGRIVRIPRRKHHPVHVLLEFLGRLVPVEIRREDLGLLDDRAYSARLTKRHPRRTRGRGRWIQKRSLGMPFRLPVPQIASGLPSS